VQVIYRRESVLIWEDKLQGPPDQGEWEAVAIINNKEYGRGCAQKLGDAREEAARLALIEHMSEREMYDKGPSGSSLGAHSEKSSATRSMQTPQTPQHIIPEEPAEDVDVDYSIPELEPEPRSLFLDLYPLEDNEDSIPEFEPETGSLFVDLYPLKDL